MGMYGEQFDNSGADDPFEGIEDIKIYTRGVYLLDLENVGNYLVRLGEVKKFQDRKHIWCFAVDCTAVWSSNPKIVAGTALSYFLKDKNDAFLYNVKRFVAAACDVEPDDVDRAGVNRICSAEQPLKDQLMAVRIEKGTSRGKDPHDYPKAMWRSPTEKELAEFGK